MVKCVDCGMLAMRRISDQQIICASRGIRMDFALPLVRNTTTDGSLGLGGRIVGTSSAPVYDKQPLCADDRVQFYSDTPQNSWVSDAAKASYLAAFQEERDCDGFVQWLPALLTPKEHREMIEREQLLKWQSDREDADKAFRLQMQRDQLATQERMQLDQLKAQDKIDERRAKEAGANSWRLAKFAAGAGVAGAILASIISGIFQLANQTHVSNSPVILVPTMTAPVINIQPAIIIPTPPPSEAR